MTDLLVAADDRTGALEAAGACAEAGLAAAVVPVASGRLQGTPALVVDLGSRHLDPAGAAALAAEVAGWDARHHAHKVDSTLRGCWAAELVGRYRATGRRVLLVPAYPALGRTCRGGVVRVHGVPVAEGPAGRDPLAPVRSSRPAQHLAAAGARSVDELGGPGDVAGWLGAGGAVAVCDAQTDADLAHVASAWEGSGVVLAGTAATVGAAAAAVAGRPPGPTAGPPLRPPLLVVVGSLHAAARAQVGALAAAGATVLAAGADETAARADLARGRTVVLTTPVVGGTDLAGAARAASRVAEVAGRLQAGAATLVLVGGDTAAAVLGERAVAVSGLLAPGVAWGRPVGGGPLVVAKPGGFGPAGLLVDLLHDPLHGKMQP